MKTFLTIGDRWLATCSVALDARGGWTSAARSRAVKNPVCLGLKQVVVRSGEKNSPYRQTSARRRPWARYGRGSMRTGDGGGAPGSEQDTVNRAYVLRSEHIRKERRDSGKSTAIHGEDHEQRGFEDHPFASSGQARNQQK